MREPLLNPKLTLPRNSCSWLIHGTDSYRISSRAILDTWGTNIQNPTKHICQIYHADPGKILVQRDQSGAEALIVAFLCMPGKFRDLFIHNIKPHVFVALHVFTKVWEEKLQRNLQEFIEAEPKYLPSINGWKELDQMIKSSDYWAPSERYYFMAKMLCHASNYGMHAGAFVIHVLQKSRGSVALSQTIAERMLNRYHYIFPEIHDWHRRVKQQMELCRTQYNLFGFPRTYTQAWTNSFLQEAYSFVPQSTVGTITNIAYTNLQYYIEDNNRDWDLLNNKHDSYLAQCPVAEADELSAKMKEFMEVELISPIDNVKFRMRSGAAVGFNWGPYDENKNPTGLKEI